MREEDKKLAEELLASSTLSDSIAKGLFFGNLLQEPLLPYPVKNEEGVDALVEELRQFALKNIDADEIDRAGRIPEKVIKGLGDLGIFGVTVDKKWGGRGKSHYCYCRLMEELAKHCGSTAILVNAHQSIGLKAIALFGTEEQKKRWLPGLTRGEGIAAFSLTEPNAGSDAAGIETEAKWDEKKGVFVINGEKQWTTNGSISSVMTLMAKVAGKVTAFIITKELPGIKILNPAQEKVGIRGTRTTNFTLTDVEVPKEQMLGEQGAGLRICLTALDYGRTTFGATCTGIGKDLFERAVSYAKKRHQFQKPLISFQMIQEKIARMGALLYAMEATTYLTASMIDRGQKDFMLEAAILKVFASEALWEMVYEAMQIYGGRSFFTNEPLERIMRDARLNMIGEGANEVLRVFIALVGVREVGTPLKELQKDFTSVFQVIKKLGPFGKRGIELVSEELQEEAKGFNRRLKLFRKRVLKLLFKFREKVVDEQLEMNKLADAAIALFTSAASLSKADLERDKTMAKYYVTRAFDKFDKAMSEPLYIEAIEELIGRL